MSVSITKALEIIKSNNGKISMIEEWASEMGYDSPVKFSWDFRNHFGERPLRILNLLKLIKAVELLTTTNKTVYEIGACELDIGDEKAFW
jgi:transcriptional regulator GlxA family with amidase domain